MGRTLAGQRKVTAAAAGGASTDRPVILGEVGRPRSIKRPGGRGSSRINYAHVEQRVARLDARFDALSNALGEQVQLAASIQSADPQLVLVMEAREETIDLTGVANSMGIEIVAEAESNVEPDDEFTLASDNPKNPLVRSCLHAVCVNQRSLDSLLSLWRAWKKDGKLPYGKANLRDFFVHLKDIRPWGPQDRLKMIDWDQHFAGVDPDQLVTIDIELWFRGSEEARGAAQAKVAGLLARDGGSITSSAIIQQIGYHGLKARVPNRVLEQLARGHFDGVGVVQSANVMYLKVSGQDALPAGEDTTVDAKVVDEPPTGAPVLCLFDGLPAANHTLLSGRVTVLDPDDLTSDYVVGERRHGTAMASIAVWGDRHREERASPRPVLVRPIMRPSEETYPPVEELPTNALAPDLMWKAFRDLFEEAPDGTPPSAPEVAIVNLSMGDPAAPFDTVISAWARMIDWLSYEYGVLVVVSAGNYPKLDLSPSNSHELAALSGEERRDAILAAIDRQQNARRLLAPAESINALTVGAIHEDGAKNPPLGYRVDPHDGLGGVSPVSATGSGYRRSLKPDLAAPGGRAYFLSEVRPTATINFPPASPLGPGIKVASPNGNKESHTVGTSAAAALVSRQAARLHDLLDEVTAGRALTRRQRAAAIKALLIHGVDTSDDLSTSPLRLERAVGNGVLLRDFAKGCGSNEAVLLFLGQIADAEEQTLGIPLPDGLSVREAKRIDATLAWLSPVNWRHRQYRRAALSFVAPEGPIPALGTARGIQSDAAKAGATTVQHLSWNTSRAWAVGRGSEISIRVKCFAQAGGLDEPVDYAAVASLWVAPALEVDVYSQVRDQVRQRVTVQPGG